MELRNRDCDATPFTTKDGSTIREYLLFRRPETPREAFPVASVKTLVG